MSKADMSTHTHWCVFKLLRVCVCLLLGRVRLAFLFDGFALFSCAEGQGGGGGGGECNGHPGRMQANRQPCWMGGLEETESVCVCVCVRKRMEISLSLAPLKLALLLERKRK